MKKTLQIIACAVLVLSLVFNAVGGSFKLPIAPSGGSSVEGTGLAHNAVILPDGTFQFEHNGVKYKSEYERLLADDGFIYGMDYNTFGPWASQGSCLGDNEINGVKNLYNDAVVRRSLYNMKLLGYTAVNVWIGNNGGAYTYDHDTGYVTGLNAAFIENLKLLLESCRATGVDLVPSILPHGVTGGIYNDNFHGLTPQQIYYKYFAYYFDEDARKEYIDKGVKAIVDIMKDYQDCIVMVNLMVENGSAHSNETELGMDAMGNYYGVSWDSLGTLINQMHDAVKEDMLYVPTSVEDMAWDTNSYKYNDLKVDIIGFNNYNNGTSKQMELRYSTRPAYSGETNYSESRENYPTDDVIGRFHCNYLESAIEEGLKGSFFFNWMSNGADHMTFFNKPSTDDYTGFKTFATEMAYKITDLKNEHKGITNAVDVPKILYNRGTKDVYWLGARGADSYTVEKSLDGGATWTTLVSKISGDDCMLQNGFYTVTDDSIKETDTYCFRVTGHFDDGSTTVSEVSNQAQLYIPEEMFVDASGNYAGGFEGITGLTGDRNAENSNGWYDYGNIGRGMNGEYSSADAHSGSQCYHIDVENGIGEDLLYYYMEGYNLKLKPNTQYTISAWYKQTRGTVSLTVRDKSNNNLCWVPPGTTGEDWEYRDVNFVTDDTGLVTVVLMSMSEQGDGPNRIWLDDISITEAV